MDFRPHNRTVSAHAAKTSSARSATAARVVIRTRRLAAGAVSALMAFAPAAALALALTASPAAAASGGLPVIEGTYGHESGAQSVTAGRLYMTMKLKVVDATSVKVRIVGYDPANNPNQPLNINIQHLHVAVTAGPLALKHTGPGNLWQVLSYETKPRLAVLSYKNDVTARACNQQGCSSHTFHFSRGLT
jgi:hypothetical protein